MNEICIASELIIALSIVIVWGFRFDNIKKEFKEYGYSDSFRNIIGITKGVLSLLLVGAIWYPSLALIPALLMAILMMGAQYSHYKIRNKWSKYLPSLFILILCLLIVSHNM